MKEPTQINADGRRPVLLALDPRTRNALASEIADQLMKRNDGSRKQCLRLMQVNDRETDPGGAGWGRQPMIDLIARVLQADIRVDPRPSASKKSPSGSRP